MLNTTAKFALIKKFAAKIVLVSLFIVFLSLITKTVISEDLNSQGPKVASAQESCSDDTYYCDGDRNIHKTGGYWDGNQCVYAYVDSGSCGGGGSSTDWDFVDQPVDAGSGSSGSSAGSAQGSAQGASQVCEWVRLSPECDWSTNQVYEVSQNSCSGEYNRTNYHYQEGACGYNPQQPQPAAPTPSCTDDVYYCDGNAKIHKTGGYWDGNKCVYDFQNVGSCGETPTRVTTQGSPITQTVNNDSNSSSAASSGSRSSAEASVRNSVTINNSNYQTQSQTVNVPPNQIITIPMYARKTEKVKQVVREVPAIRYTDTEVVCPQGTTKIINGDSITCQAPVQQVIQAAVPQVVTVAAGPVQELPKTGAPLAALALGGLLPAGMKLRKFGSKDKVGTSANYIWEQRQLDV